MVFSKGDEGYCVCREGSYPRQRDPAVEARSASLTIDLQSAVLEKHGLSRRSTSLEEGRCRIYSWFHVLFVRHTAIGGRDELVRARTN